MENLVNFWKNKRVLLTGHTGFKGSWLSLMLQSLQANVLGYSLDPPTKPNLFSVAKVEEGMKDIRGDIRDLPLLKKEIAAFQPEVVIHMAAQPLVRYSYQHPIETFSTNVMGTVNVCEAVRDSDTCRSLLVITTDKCYENREWHWGYRETDPLGGHDPYSSSKSCTELVVSSYRNSFFKTHDVGLATARAGNVLGGGDWAQDRLVPDLIMACIKNQEIEIRNPQSTRPWQHVLDPLYGYLKLAQALYETPSSYSEPWNFGPNESDIKCVSWIAEKIVDLWGASTSWNPSEGKHPHEAAILKLDTSKSRALLDWTPIYSIETVLQSTVEWYQAYHYTSADIQVFTQEQIKRYLKTRATENKPLARTLTK